MRGPEGAQEEVCSAHNTPPNTQSLFPLCPPPTPGSLALQKPWIPLAPNVTPFPCQALETVHTPTSPTLCTLFPSGPLLPLSPTAPLPHPNQVSPVNQDLPLLPPTEGEAAGAPFCSLILSHGTCCLSLISGGWGMGGGEGLTLFERQGADTHLWQQSTRLFSAMLTSLGRAVFV